jgi:hypothetical protein
VKINLLILGIATLSTASNCAASPAKVRHSWPKLRQFSKTISLDMSSNEQYIQVFIRDLHNQPVYRFECFSGNETAVQKRGLIYSGGLLCGLGEITITENALFGNRSLLSDGSTSAMFSRGNFNPEELIGACAKYPDYGTTRFFNLRGFRIKLALANLQIKSGYSGSGAFRKIFNNLDRHDFPIGKAILTIVVTQNPMSRTKYSEISQYKDPNGNQELCRFWRNSKYRIDK